MSRAVISTIGHDRPGVVSDLSKIVHDLNLSIEDSRMTVLGGEFAVLMSVTGGDLGLTRLEEKLAKLAEQTGLQYLYRMTGDRQGVEGRIPYTVTVTATDDDGAVTTKTMRVLVANLPAVVVAGPDLSGGEGDALAVTGVTFSDAGVLDTHTATIDWGDGSTPDDITPGAGTVTGLHVYADDGQYTVTVTVTV